MAAVWMRLRAEARDRRRAWLALALIFGLGAGASVAAIAGARRTHSAYPRFVEAQNGFHAVTGGGAEDGYEERYEALKKHPMVTDFTELVIVGAEITIPARRGREEIVTLFPEVLLGADPSGRNLYETNKAKILAGRLADRTNPDETMVPLLVADRYGIEVGDEIIAGYGIDLENFPSPLKRIPLRVVGIYAAPGEFEAVGQNQFLAVYTTPALFSKHRDLVPPLIPDWWNLGLHLRGGSAAGTAFKQAVERDFNLDVPVIESTTRKGVQNTNRLYAVALWLLGSLIAAATVVIVGQMLARQQILEGIDYPTLRAMGVSRRQLLGLGMLRGGIIAVGAAGVATVVGYLLSPLTPIGPARIAEPDPGFAFDAAAGGVGVVAVLMIVPVIMLVPSLRAARAAARPANTGGAEPSAASSIVRTISRTFRSPATATGLRMALEPGRGRTSVPVRSTILAVALGVAAVTASVVVGRSLTHLLDTPSLTGFTYDAIIPNDDEFGGTNEERAARLAAFPFIDRAAIGTALNVVFDGIDSFLLGLEGDGAIGFAVIEGRAPTDAEVRGIGEIALGPTTARRLGAGIGDTIEFLYSDSEQLEEEQEEEGRPISRRLATGRARVVGVAAVPPVPWAVTEPGEGAVMSTGAIARINPLEVGGCCFVAFKPGTDLAAARGELEEAGFSPNLRTKRTDLATLEKISELPIILSAIFAAIASAALAHVLMTAARRRRRDLAILKTLGFVKRQVRGAVAWQVSTIAVLAIAVGIPAGIVLGRWGWRLVANQFGVVPVSVAPLGMLALLLPAGLLLGNLVAAVPGHIAARTQPALVLRTE